MWVSREGVSESGSEWVGRELGCDRVSDWVGVWVSDSVSVSELCGLGVKEWDKVNVSDQVSDAKRPK